MSHKWTDARPDAARHACLNQLSLAYEAHAEAEQLHAGRKEFEAATIEHGYCVILLRAMVAEDINPKPKNLP